MLLILIWPYYKEMKALNKLRFDLYVLFFVWLENTQGHKKKTI